MFKLCDLQERDIDRTVGINTGHVGTSDFRLEEADREFVVEVCVTRLSNIKHIILILSKILKWFINN